MCTRSPHCSQELADAKVTHNIDGFVHKAFSVAFGTSFDEVCAALKGSLHGM